MVFADMTLARRLERAEGYACTCFAAARARFNPESRAAFAECAGAFLAFDGIDSPVTQSFGLGLSAELTAEVMDEAEDFFFSRGSAAIHEICPFAGPDAIRLICTRGYLPLEISNVLYQPLTKSQTETPPNIR